MPELKPKIGIVYWGNRGGGKVLADQLVDQALSGGFDFLFFGRPTRKDGSGRVIPIYWCWYWVIARRHLVKQAVAHGIRLIVLPMASPWDLFLGRKLRRRGVQVSRIIHDASTHPGDVFPPQFWIKLLCRDTNVVVALSSFVANQLINRKYVTSKSILVGKLPSLKVADMVSDPSSAPRRNFLLIGRGRTYKGLENLLSAWVMVGDERAHLTVAGEGHKVDPSISRITHVDRWLSDSEVLQYIGMSDVVVLPYIEASQSGIISLAHSLHRPVIVTPVGGLAEQVTDEMDGLIVKGMDLVSLAAAMNRSIHFNFDFSHVSNNKDTESLLALCVSRFQLEM